MFEAQPTTTDDFTIFQHDTRPDWGNAIVAWERGDKRGYQFEDGKLRVFKRGWFERLLEIDLPLPKATATAERLQRKLGLTPWRAPSRKSRDTISFDDQLRLFDHLYDEGFDGMQWRNEKRGADAKRTLKRHRDAAIASARDALSAERLDGWIASERFDEAWDAVMDVLRGTDLINKRDRDGFKDLGANARRNLVIRIRNLLWGDATYAVRFERFVGTLAMATGKEPSWRLATVLSALVFPDEHVCVRSTITRAQAAWMAPRIRWSKAPNAPLYMRIKRMVHAVRSELVNAGHVPADLLDVYDFMWTTLRPKAREQLDALDSDDTAQEVV